MSGSRKDDHLNLAAQQQRELHGDMRLSTGNDWDDVRIVHHSLAGINAEDVDISSPGFPTGDRWKLPFYINGMTGGSHMTGFINTALAIAAAETGIAVATGSMSMYLKDESTLPTFRVMRDRNPDGWVMANLGADATLEQAQRVVDALGADALQIHINSVQETVMPEGSREFAAWPEKLANIAQNLSVPLMVKEVGFGMSRQTLQALHQLGVQVADVSGRGGTNFAQIENDRRAGRDYSYLLDYGQSAAFSLLDAQSAQTSLPRLFASGGVRHPYDVVRGLALGASAVGVAGTFLHTVLEQMDSDDLAGSIDRGAAALVEVINQWRQRLTELYAMMGAASTEDLQGLDVLVEGSLAQRATLRGVDLASLANRWQPR